MGDRLLPETTQRMRDRLSAGLNLLPDKPEEDTESTWRALCFAAAGIPLSVEQARAGELPRLDEAGLAVLDALIARRLDGVPLSHLTGRQRFMGLDLIAGFEALIPRKETELLAREAIGIATERAASGADVRVLDVCTGSGNVALAIAHHVPEAHVLAADLSPAAVDLARRNAVHLGLADRVSFRCGDLLAPFDEPEFLSRIDLLTCNPPYIASAKLEGMPAEISRNEPRLAFDGGAFGLSIVLRLVQETPRFLRAGGWLVFEVGLGQGPGLVRRMRGTSSFTEVIPVNDESGAVRMIAARVPGEVRPGANAE